MSASPVYTTLLNIKALECAMGPCKVEALGSVSLLYSPLERSVTSRAESDRSTNPGYSTNDFRSWSNWRVGQTLVSISLTETSHRHDFTLIISQNVDSWLIPSLKHH